MSRPGTSRRSERGAAALEFAIIVPALGLLIAVMIGGARIWFAHTTLEQIAGTAARSATLATNPATARANADRIARDQARTAGLNCVGMQVEVDTSGFQVPVGQPAQVRVNVSCAVPLADLILPGWPGSWELRTESGSALDRYRRRG